MNTRCHNCGDDLDEVIVMNGDVAQVLVNNCPRPACQPPPTPAVLRRAAEDRWLAKQWALIHEFLS